MDVNLTVHSVNPVLTPTLTLHGPMGVRGQDCPQEPVLSEQDSRTLPRYSHQRDAFLQSPSVHHGCQIQMFSCKKVLEERAGDQRGVEGDVLASLAPPVHLSGEKLGFTLLVCMVSDFRRGHLEVSWSSPSEDHMFTALNSISVRRKHRGHSAVAIITVVTRDWPSYKCSVSDRRHRKVTKRHRTTSSDVDVRTDTVVVLAMRLILMKIIVFDTLMTIHAVIKWNASVNDVLSRDEDRQRRLSPHLLCLLPPESGLCQRSFAPSTPKTCGVP
ncbi:hypothetical protein INR49_006158 [Caranx melampygus]|nr:hypothetical protein INR49_006158 [Caranx melampygus]